MLTEDQLINDFAKRCLQDMADQDYIAARTCHRNYIFHSFLWLSHQAIEKFLKAILLYGRADGKFGHNLSVGLQRLKHLPFETKLSKSSVEFIDFIDTYGWSRYFEVSTYIRGHELAFLDKTVWELRRYCKPYIKGKTSFDPYKINGLLEQILENRTHPSRKALIWRNPFQGERRRKKVPYTGIFSASNSPLSLHPEIIDEIKKYVTIPRNVVREYKKLLAEREENQD